MPIMQKIKMVPAIHVVGHLRDERHSTMAIAFYFADEDGHVIEAKPIEVPENEEMPTVEVVIPQDADRMDVARFLTKMAEMFGGKDGDKIMKLEWGTDRPNTAVRDKGKQVWAFNSADLIKREEKMLKAFKPRKADDWDD